MKSKFLLIIIIITLFFLPKVNIGQVALGTDASKFVLFTSSGAVSDNAIAHSHITGDVGTSTPGPITGFGNVNGVMHPGADVATAACVTDLLATIAQINALPATLTGPLSLGSGGSITPGVWSIPGNATLTLDLFIDGQNDSNSEFIIKVAGTFGTNTLSSVKLINGALACHVFWKIDGAVTMASLSTMRGNIISGGAIVMGSGDSLEGRAFSTVGLISIDGITAYTPIGCSSPILTGPTAPDLASVVCYTIFSSDGALANTIGTTTVIGDVGKNNDGSSITGWAPGDVTGTLHSLQDPSTIQCAIDLSNLYNTLNAMVPDIELLYPAQFGHDLVLTPHVYLMNGLTTFTDSLYLDAQGNANGVFVIKIIGGALNTSTYSKVKLINGALSENVFWMVQGAVSVNNYSVFRGTIVVPVGALNFVNTGIILDGRALTMTGAITTQGLAAAMPPGCGVICAPTIITEPANQTACSGDSISFTVVATGSGLTYQWRKGSSNLSNTGNISGTNTDTLTINPVSISDVASNYNVVITGTCSPNDTSINVSLVVNSAIIISSQPANQTACTGDSISFTVSATGTGLTYQWRKGSSNLSNTGNISGTNTDTLTINPVSISDVASNYNVVITGTCSPNDTSINVSLVVNSAIIIAIQPANQTVCAGDSISFTVSTIGTGLTYQWRKGSSNLSNTGNISGTNSDTLTINPVSISDVASNYNVIITGICSPNDTSINVSLIVNSAIIIAIQPANQTVCAESLVNLTVSATGTGLTYQWRKGSSNLSNTGNISGSNTDTLTINPVNTTDSASNYNVIITGICSPNDTSINTSLFVNPIPIAIANSNSPVCANGSINLTAQTTQGGTYIWIGPNGYTSLVQNPVIIFPSAAEAGNYSLTVTANGCSSFPSTVTIIINNCLTDISVVKTVNNSNPIIGQSVIFTIVATNIGTYNATGVTVTDILQSGYTYVSSTTTNGTYDPLTGVWVIGNLNNGVSEILTITVKVNTEGIYVNTATINSNDIDADISNNVSSIELFPTDFNIPEGFSPNGDGINDEFVIRGINNYPANKIIIFNRWGNKVFEANPYQNTWGGKSTNGLRVGGDELPIGTYFYLLDLGDSSDVIKGTIYLNK